MKKIALAFYGQLRNIEESYPYWKANVIDPLQIQDVYIHTGREEVDEYRYNTQATSKFKVGPSVLLKFIELFKPKLILQSNYKDIEKTDQWFKPTERIRFCFKTIKNLQQTSGNLMNYIDSNINDNYEIIITSQKLITNAKVIIRDITNKYDIYSIEGIKFNPNCYNWFKPQDTAYMFGFNLEIRDKNDAILYKTLFELNTSTAQYIWYFMNKIINLINDDEYDAIILSRTDNIFVTPIIDLPIKDNEILASTMMFDLNLDGQYQSVSDIVVAGNVKTMKKFASIGTNYKKLYDSGIHYHGETLVGENLKALQVNVRKFFKYPNDHYFIRDRPYMIDRILEPEGSWL